VALDAAGGTERWRARLTASAASLAAGHGTIAAISTDGALSRFSPAGAAESALSPEGTRAAPRVAPLLAPNGALLVSETGTLLFCDPAGEQSELYHPEAEVTPHGVAISARRIVVATAGGLYAVDTG